MEYSVINVILRTFLSLGVLIVLARIMGRRSVAQLTLYDYVLGLVLGDIGASFAVDRSISVIDGIASLIACTAWIIIVNFVMLRSVPARKFVDPEPLMVIYNGCILEENLRKSFYTINSILELLREREIFDPGSIALAVIESNGQLSIIKKQDEDSVQESNKSKKGYIDKFALHMMGRALVIDGKITDRVSEHSGISEAWLIGIIKKRNLEMEDIMVALITPEGRLYIDKKDDNISFHDIRPSIHEQ